MLAPLQRHYLIILESNARQSEQKLCTFQKRQRSSGRNESLPEARVLRGYRQHCPRRSIPLINQPLGVG